MSHSSEKGTPSTYMTSVNFSIFNSVPKYLAEKVNLSFSKNNQSRSIRIFQLTSFREQSTKNGGKTLGFPHQSQDHNTSPTKPNKTPRVTPAINFIPPTTSTLILDEFVPDLGELVEVDVDVALDAEPVAEIVVELELEDEKIAIGILAIVVQVPPNKIISGLVKAEVKG